MKLRTLVDPFYAWKRLKHYGVKRSIISLVKTWPSLEAVTRKLIQGAIVASHPIDYVRRKRVAREVAQTSPWRGFVPQSVGYRIVPPSGLPDVETVVEKCRAIYRSWQSSASYSDAPENLRYLNLLSPDPLGYRREVLVADLAGYPEIQRFVLGSVLREIAIDYLGEVPVVATVQLLLTPPNKSLEGPQLFHLDHGASKELVLFLAVNDIDDDCGPLNFFPANISELLRRKVDFRGRRLSDEVAFAVAGRENLVVATGEAGTCTIVDTARCVHYGSRGNAKDRLVLQVRYITRFSSSDHHNALGQLRFGDTDAADPCQRLLMGA